MSASLTPSAMPQERPPEPTPAIAIVIPCRDEAESIATTVGSLLAQTLPPAAIVVVDDGSTDGTAGVVAGLAAAHPRVVRLVRTHGDAPRASGAKIVAAFARGLSSLDLDGYAFVGKFDADLDFPPDYLAAVVGHFARDPRLGLVGGVCHVRGADGAWREERVADEDHVRGALKLYPVAAFRDIGGLQPCMGWDTLDEYQLRYRGYGVLADGSLAVRHFRQTHETTAAAEKVAKQARAMRNFGFSWPLALASYGKRVLRSPSELRHLPTFLATFGSATRASTLTEPEIAHVRRYRYARIRGKLFG